MRGMDPPDLGQQGVIGCLARTFGPAPPGIMPRRSDTHRIAHDANWKHLALSRDEAEFHLGASEKMSSVFLERRIFRLNRRDSGGTGFVIHFRKEVICHAESLFARSA
jgi:hypothetical protein